MRESDALTQIEHTDGMARREFANPNNGNQAPEVATTAHAADAGGSRVIDRVSPDEVESVLYQRIAEQPGLTMTTLTSVDCDTMRCRIVFSGLEANPQYVDKYHDLLNALAKPPWNDYRTTSGSIGTREVSPGAREYVLQLPTWRSWTRATTQRSPRASMLLVLAPGHA